MTRAPVTPLVSIVLATYNGVPYLRAQLESLLQQSYQNLEIIIQDDQSNDETWSILQSYASLDSRIQLYKNETNLGITHNFLSLLEKSSGDYIAFSDQDDIWAESKITDLINHIGESSLIYSDSALIDAQGKSLNKTLIEHLNVPPYEGRYLLDLHISNSISGHAMLITRHLKDILLESSHLFTSYNTVYDIIVSTAASLVGKVSYLKKVLVFHRIHESNNNNCLFETKPHNKPPVIERMKLRVATKVHQHQFRVAILETLHSFLTPPLDTIFKKTPSKQFNYILFNFALFQRLRGSDLPQEYAFKLSKGRLFYILFKWL